jgi:6-phosphofructokinase
MISLLESVDVGRQTVADYEATAGREAVERLRELALCHIQRGGSPTAYDRHLSSRLGAATAEALADGRPGIMVGVSGPRAEHYPLEEVAAGERVLDEDTYDVAPTLAGLRRHEEQEGRKP